MLDRINILLSFVLLASVVLYTTVPKNKMLMLIIIVLLFVYFICRDIYISRKTKRLMNELNESKQKMQDLHNPLKAYERLGVDVLALLIGDNLVSITDSEQEGLLLPKISALRQSLADELGYIKLEVVGIVE